MRIRNEREGIFNFGGYLGSSVQQTITAAISTERRHAGQRLDSITNYASIKDGTIFNSSVQDEVLTPDIKINGISETDDAALFDIGDAITVDVSGNFGSSRTFTLVSSVEYLNQFTLIDDQFYPEVNDIVDGAVTAIWPIVAPARYAGNHETLVSEWRSGITSYGDTAQIIATDTYADGSVLTIDAGLHSSPFGETYSENPNFNVGGVDVGSTYTVNLTADGGEDVIASFDLTDGINTVTITLPTVTLGTLVVTPPNRLVATEDLANSTYWVISNPGSATATQLIHGAAPNNNTLIHQSITIANGVFGVFDAEFFFDAFSTRWMALNAKYMPSGTSMTAYFDPEANGGDGGFGTVHAGLTPFFTKIADDTFRVGIGFTGDGSLMRLGAQAKTGDNQFNEGANARLNMTEAQYTETATPQPYQAVPAP